MRKLLLPLAVAVAVAILAIAARWVFFSDREVPGELAATPAPTPPAAASPSVAATLQPSPPADGAIPLPAWPASAIPWDEVGPGWFLVGWQPIDGGSAGAETLSLLDPEGTVYSTGVVVEHWAMDWVPGGVATFNATGVTENLERPSGDVEVVDLRSGESQLVASGIPFPSWQWVASDGSFIGAHSEGDGFFFTTTRDGVEQSNFCWGYAHTRLSPDGQKLACLTPRDDGRTDVNLAGTSGAASVQAIDIFPGGISEYAFNGWIDSDTFVLSRRDGDAVVYFTYNVVTRKIADLALPFSGELNLVQVLLDGSGYAQEAWDTHSVAFFSASGDAIATVDCAAAQKGFWAVPVVVSGRRAAVVCPDYRLSPVEVETRELVLVDLDSGATTIVLPFLTEPGRANLHLFPYPETY